jgi:hypothetical protein
MPVVIEGPPVPPPPPELDHIRFDDFFPYFAVPDRSKAEEGLSSQATRTFKDLALKYAGFRPDLEDIEQLADICIPSALNKIRYLTEKVLLLLCRNNKIAWGQAEPTLERMMGPLVAANIVPKNTAIHLRTIQSNASPGSHYQESPLSRGHLNIASQALVEVLEWAGTTGLVGGFEAIVEPGFAAFRGSDGP